MPLDYLPNCATQLERALRALLFSVGAVGAKDCFISNDHRTRNTEDAPLTDGITDILAFQSTTGEAEDSGNEKFTVRITNKFAVPTQPSETNPGGFRLAYDQRIGKQMLALSESNGQDMRDPVCDLITEKGRALATATGSTAVELQEAANNADMAEFTCLSLRYLGMTRGQPDDNSCAWVEVRTFEISACPTAIN